MSCNLTVTNSTQKQPIDTMKKSKKLLGCALLTLVVLSCGQQQDTKNDQHEKVEVITNHSDTGSESEPDSSSEAYVKTHEVGNYAVTIEANNAELSTLKITTKGLENEEEEVCKIEGKVIETYMTDLNQDGFKEFIITVCSNDDSGNIDIIGIASNKGKSLSDIAIKEPTVLRDVYTDQLNVHPNSMTREFQSNGKTVKYNYQLTEGEAGYVLTAHEE